MVFLTFSLPFICLYCHPRPSNSSIEHPGEFEILPIDDNRLSGQLIELDSLEIRVKYIHGRNTDGNIFRRDPNSIATCMGKSSDREEWLTDERGSASGKKNYSRPRDLSTVRDHDPKRAHEVRCNDAGDRCHALWMR